MDEQDQHIIEALGKARIFIRKGKVIEVGEPKISFCPLFEKYRNIKKITNQAIRENIQFRIDDFGMCTPQRILKMKDFLSFGISEILGTILKEGMIDCVVAVCEGCGTVILTDSEMVQGVGGRVSGLVSTTPIKEIIDTIGRENILDPEYCTINQAQGVLKAINMGYKKIAVTIVDPHEAQRLRKMEKKFKDVKIYLFVVHTTGITSKDAETFFNHADVITGCASKWIKEIGADINVFSVGASIPIYGATEAGEKFIHKRIQKIGGLKEKKDAKIPKPLI